MDFLHNAFKRIRESYDILSIGSTWINFFLLTLTFLGGLFQRRIQSRIKENKKKRIFGFYGRDCEIIIPTFRARTILHDVGSKAEEKLNPSIVNMFNSDDAYALILIPQMLNSIQSYSDIHITLLTSNQTDPNKNKLCIGGPLANMYVRNIFQGKAGFRFASEFRFGYALKELSPESECFRDLYVVNKDRYSLFFKDSSNQIEATEHSYPSGYMVLIKIAGSDYHDARRSSVHIMFGYTGNMTLLSVRILTDEYILKLYKRLKKSGHLKHYFLVFNYTETQEIDLDSMKDITDVMFS